MGSEPVYYLSPHADDVGFSCAGSVALDVAAGRRVTLITAFLSGGDMAERQREDKQAAALLGCEYRCLELPDAPDRPEVRGALDIFMPFGPPHLGITNEVVSRLLRHIAPPAELLAPLAIGGHIDHRIVHEAARSLAYHLGGALKLSFYEDLPYSLAPYALGRRLMQLGYRHQGPPDAPLALDLKRADFGTEVAAHVSFLLTWPLCQRYFFGLRRLRCYIAARKAVQADSSAPPPGFPPRLRPVVRPIDSPSALKKRHQAVAAYASQWPLFAHSYEAMTERLDSYARRLSGSTQIVERFFSDDGVFGPAPR